MHKTEKGNKSIWLETAPLTDGGQLSGDLHADAAVIGGGMTGILTAYFLSDAGLRTVVLEADRPGSGQTKNTTAKITSQHGLVYHRLTEQLGEDPARQYAEANESAIRQYFQLAEKLKIECDLAECPSYLYTLKDEGPLRKECEAAQRLGIDASLTRETELPFPIAGALRFDRQARFHPLKFLNAVAGDVEIYSGTKVEIVEENRVLTSRGAVTAEHIIFASHFPFLNVPGYYFMRMHQERSYVLALENAAKIDGMYLGIDQDGYSFRPQGDLLLLGGGGHRTGENSAGGKYRGLRDAAQKYWPGCSETARWSAQDCMPMDGVPYIGRFSSTTPNWYVATGFQKWGMTTAMVSAMLISDLILHGSSPWEQVFNPQRFTPSASSKQLMEDTVQAAKGLTRKLFAPPRADIDALPNGHGGVVEYDGEKAGVYKNEDGETFIVGIRCPHLGCQLEWNPDEKSWDCPCHGSRFDYKGRLLDTPAQIGLDYQ